MENQVSNIFKRTFKYEGESIVFTIRATFEVIDRLISREVYRVSELKGLKEGTLKLYETPDDIIDYESIFKDDDNVRGTILAIKPDTYEQDHVSIIDIDIKGDNKEKKEENLLYISQSQQVIRPAIVERDGELVLLGYLVSVETN